MTGNRFILLAAFCSLICAVFGLISCGSDEVNFSNPPGTGELAGEATYTGTLGQVDDDHRIWLECYLFSDVSMEGVTWLRAVLNANPGSYTFFSVKPGDYHCIVGFDADGNGEIDDGDPYEIYDDVFILDGSSTKITVAGDDRQIVNIQFDDSHLLQSP